LAAMLQRIQAIKSKFGYFFPGRPYAKYAAGILRTFFPWEQLVIESTIACHTPSLPTNPCDKMGV
jgi:hypothetical protein